MKWISMLYGLLIVLKKNKKEEKRPPLPAVLYYLLLIPVFVSLAAFSLAAADTPDDSGTPAQPQPPAQHLALDEISVTGSRVATTVKETPVAIEIVDQKELETVKFVDSRNELLNRIPGNSLTRNLRIPMGGKNYTINLLDGMAVRSFGRGTNGFIEEVNSFDIQRVEVIKGPASALYGSNALGGVINVITRDPPAEPEYRLWGELGNNDRGRGGVSAAGSLDAFGYFLDANALAYEGSQDRTARARRAVSGKLIYDFETNARLSLRTEYLETEEESPGTLDQQEFDTDWQQAPVQDAYTDQQITSAVAGYVAGIGEQSEVDIKYSIRHHKEQGMPSYSPTSAYGTDDMLNHNLVATYHHDFDFLRSRVIAGMDLQHSTVEEVNHTDRTTASSVDRAASWDIVAQVISPFAQYEVSPFEPLRVTLAARYDNITYTGKNHDNSRDEEAAFSNITPKAGLTFDLSGNNSLWLGYSTGFVVPSRTALFSNTRYITDPNLDPEKARNYEAGIRGRLINDRVKYDVALYQTTIEDMVVIEDRPGKDAYVNAGMVEVKGVETSLAVQPAGFLRFDVAYTCAVNKYKEYITGTDDYSGNYLGASPLHHVNARVNWMPTDDLDLELEYDHISAYHTNSDNTADPKGEYDRPDLFNLRLTYHNGTWSIWAHALNLFNTEYAERVSYSKPGGSSAGGRDFTSGDERSLYAGVSHTWK